MSFDCKNVAPQATCGQYVIPYIGNLEYVSNGLLSIINTIILPPQIGNAPYDITDTNCNCLPICPTGTTETSGCVELGDTVVFNCVTWEKIKELLVDVSSLPQDTGGYIPLLCQTLKCILKNTTNINHGFAAQIERFLCLAESLNTRLDSICCNNRCPEIVGDLLCLLMQILTKLISAISKAATLTYYNDCDTDVATGNKIVTSFFDCMACDFVNDLCELEKLIPELSAIVIGFATCDMKQCTPCYTAPSVPRKVRPMCPTNMMQNTGYYGGGYSPYQSQGGCGCGCKK